MPVRKGWASVGRGRRLRLKSASLPMPLTTAPRIRVSTFLPWGCSLRTVTKVPRRVARATRYVYSGNIMASKDNSVNIKSGGAAQEARGSTHGDLRAAEKWGGVG